MSDLRREIDERYSKPLHGTSVEIETDDSPERTQTVNVRDFGRGDETPAQFRERIDQEGNEE
jgi:hypothetical protein